MEDIVHRQDTIYYEHTVEKDTIINDIIYKKVKAKNLENQNDWWYLGYDYNNQIYRYDENYGLLPWENYNLNIGDYTPIFEGGVYVDFYLYVADIKYISIKGITRKVLSIEYPKGRFIDYWVEGIGAIYSHMISGCPEHGTSTLIGCYLGDECLFDIDDIPLLSNVSGIEDDDQLRIFPDRIIFNPGDERNSIVLYDINGIMVCGISDIGAIEIDTTSLSHGIYILEVTAGNSFNQRKKIIL